MKTTSPCGVVRQIWTPHSYDKHMLLMKIFKGKGYTIACLNTKLMAEVARKLMALETLSAFFIIVPNQHLDSLVEGNVCNF